MAKGPPLQDVEEDILQLIDEKPTMIWLNKWIANGVCVKGKWKELGYKLLDHTDVDIIEIDHWLSVKECCSMMFNKWLRTAPKPSWRQVTEALRSIDLTDLAAEVERRLLPVEKCVGPVVPMLPGGQQILVDDVPTEMWVIRYGIRDGVCAATSIKWKDLGHELLDREYHKELSIIETNYRFDVRTQFSKMFNKWTQTAPRASWRQLINALYKIGLTTLAKDVEQRLQPMKEHDGPVVPELPSGQQHQPDQVSPDKGNVQAKDLTTTLSQNLLRDMKVKYTQMMDDVKNELKHHDVFYLLDKFRDADIDDATIFSKEDAIDKIKTVKMLCYYLSSECKIYDYEILEVFMISIDCTKAVEIIRDFTKDFNNSILKDLNLLDFPKSEFEDFKPSGNNRKLVIKYESMTLSKAEEQAVRTVLYKQFKLKDGAIRFVNIVDGSILLIYRISQKIKNYLLQYKITTDEAVSLRSYKIMQLIIDDEVEMKMPVKHDDDWTQDAIVPWTSVVADTAKTHHVDFKLLPTYELGSILQGISEFDVTHTTPYTTGLYTEAIQPNEAQSDGAEFSTPGFKEYAATASRPHHFYSQFGTGSEVRTQSQDLSSSEFATEMEHQD